MDGTREVMQERRARIVEANHLQPVTGFEADWRELAHRLGQAAGSGREAPDDVKNMHRGPRSRR
jgi:hypothetical protein